MTDSLRVLVYTPGEALGEEREVENALSALQAIVGGYIEVVAVRGDLALQVVCNEEGRLDGLPYNRADLLGTFFVTRSKGSEFASLTDADIRVARTLLDQRGPT